MEGAEQELKELAAQLDQDKIASSVANRGVTWSFNPPPPPPPPLAPHFGGVLETTIKSGQESNIRNTGKFGCYNLAPGRVGNVYNTW